MLSILANAIFCVLNGFFAWYAPGLWTLIPFGICALTLGFCIGVQLERSTR